MRPHLLPKRRKLRSYRIVANLIALQGRALRGLICSTPITQDVRDYAATLNDPSLNPHPEERSASKDEAEAGMKAMSEKFHALRDQVYIDAENGPPATDAGARSRR
jgi:hypothetical protein